jgi:uncharacterized protein YjcR
VSGAIFFKNKRLDPHMARRLYDIGYCDQQIADELGVSRDCAREWRRRNALPGHKTLYQKKEVKRKSTLAELEAEARAHHMSYGVYMDARREGRV